MATTFTIEHVWPVRREVVLAHLFDEELGNRCNAAMRSADRTRVSIDRREDGTVVQRYEVKAKDIPKAATKALKPEVFHWTEESTYDPKTESFRWHITTNVMQEKIRCGGRLYYVELGDRTRRVVEGEIEIKIPLAGKIAEKVIVGQLENTYEELSGAESGYFAEQQESNART